MTSPELAATTSPAYGRLVDLLEAGEPVILDGANATELERAHARAGDLRNSDRGLWGTWALYDTPYAVKDVHRRYVEVPLRRDLDEHLGGARRARSSTGGPPGAGDDALARRRTARHRACPPGDRRGRPEGDAQSPSASTATSTGPSGRPRSGCLLRALREDPPDLLLLETMSLIREGLTFEAVEAAVETGSRSGSRSAAAATASAASTASTGAGRKAISSAGPPGASRSSASRALLLNCLPPDHLDGMLPVAPRLHRPPARRLPEPRLLLGRRLALRRARRPERYAELALDWRAQGAQIVGGCCGTSPEHIAAAREALAGTRAGRPRRPPASFPREPAPPTVAPRPAVVGRARPQPLPAPAAGARLRARRLRPDRGKPARLEAPVPERHRGRQAVPRRRLRHRPTGDPARAERRRGRRRDRPPASGRREHARERLPERRRESRRRPARSISTATSPRALRRRRRKPLPGTRRSVRSRDPPAARLLGPQPARPPARAPAATARPRRGRVRDAALDPRPAAHGGAARGNGLVAS